MVEIMGLRMGGQEKALFGIVIGLSDLKSQLQGDAKNLPSLQHWQLVFFQFSERGKSVRTCYPVQLNFNGPRKNTRTL